jgi:hypothetical protein
MKKSTIFYNHSEGPIFISRSIKADAFGLGGRMENKIIIMPGDGIDLKILNLKQNKPRSKNK